MLAGLERAAPRLNIEDFLVEHHLLEGLLGCRAARVNPGFHLDVGVVGQLEAPLGGDAPDVLQSNGDAAWLFAPAGWDLPEVPAESRQIRSELFLALV